MHRTAYRAATTLLGVFGALAGAVAAVLLFLWLMDQSGPTGDLLTLGAAVAAGLVAAALVMARRALVLHGAGELPANQRARG